MSRAAVRLHGKPPYTVVVVHGGPGAAGEMYPVAQELSSDFGVLEPLQSELSVEGQVRELRDAINQGCNRPVVLVGWSWGAWLGCLVAANHSQLVKKLVLVGSGPFETTYAEDIRATRMSRMTDSERRELQELEELLDSPSTSDREALFDRFGKLMSKSDSYEPIDTSVDDRVEVSPRIFQAVWPEASELRRSGQLLQLAGNIRCPVVAIHGDYDPHPRVGVQEPLSRVIKDFRFIELHHCGHKPWIEREAKDQFYKTLRIELVDSK